MAALVLGCSAGERPGEVIGTQRSALQASAERCGAPTPRLSCVSEESGQLVAHFGYEYTLPGPHENDSRSSEDVRKSARSQEDVGAHSDRRRNDDEGGDDEGDDDEGDDDETENADSCDRSLTIAVGSRNRFSPSPVDRGQPKEFVPGVHDNVFRVPFAGSVTWTLAGKSITAGPQSTKCTPPVPDSVDVSWADAPVLLEASRGYSPIRSEVGKVELTQAIEFEIPSKLRVQQGNAGNQIAVLTFKDEEGDRVRCTYRGGARACRLDDELELAKGRYYNFASCTRGYEAGDNAVSRSFSLELKGGDEKQGRTAVELHLGANACSAPLDPPITPEESVRMRRAFSWQRTEALPEVGPDGNPALRYAVIYVRDKEELAGLDELLIHHSRKPFFVPELAPYLGRCGAIQYDGDGRGSFVFAILPALTYNLIREAALNPDPVEGDQTLFEAIVLRDAPEEMANDDGSLSWQALKSVAYHYRELRVLPEDPVQQPFWNRLKRRVAKAIAQTAKGVVRTVTDGLGEIDAFISGESTVWVDLHVLNRDAAFGGDRVMTRAWGPNAGSELRLGGIRVEVLQWSSFLLPTQFHATLGYGGTVGIKVAKEGSARNGGVCMAMENSAVSLTTALLPTDICDFRQFLGPNGFAFNRDINLNIHAKNYEIHTMAQVSDAAQYAREMMGYHPAHAEIAHGWLGTLLGGGKTIYAPCFSFPNINQEVINTGVSGVLSAASLVLGPVAAVSGEVLSTLNQVDIVMPNIKLSRDNRGVMVHEYGHFLLCSMLYDESPTSMSAFTAKRIFEGQSVDLADEAAILNEAFADFIASQVVSGVNYFAPPGVEQSQNMSYCRNFANAPICLDANGTGVEGDGSGITGNFPSRYEIAQATTLFHDAFDGTLWRGTDRPTNADAWNLNQSVVPELLEYTPTDYGDAQDERIIMPASGIRTWITKWASDFTPTLVKDELFSSLASVIRGSSWCDICQMFALHVPNSGSTMREQMDACTRAPLVNWVGAPPAPLNRLSDTCVACSPTEILQGGACMPCGSREIASPDGRSCVCADPDDVRFAGVCAPCPPGQTPNPGRTACIGCGVDAVVDLSPNACRFDDSATVVGGGSAACDQVHIADFVQVASSAPAAASCNITSFPFRIDAGASGQAPCEALQARVVVDLTFVGGSASRIYDQEVNGLFSSNGAACLPNGDCLSFGETCSLLSFSFTTGQASNIESIRATVYTGASVTFSSDAGFDIIR
ncbi:MAG: hypothetical protein SFV15_26995 [Polyangiaceae bacterium]|nr:hypothetical protein [Polyangiaceae bacterium]